MKVQEKAKYWWCVLYPENMIPNWEQEIGKILQVPYAYCIHDIDKDKNSEHRTYHVHLIIAFTNTTTYNHAYKIFEKLNAEGKRAFNKIEACIR